MPTFHEHVSGRYRRQNSCNDVPARPETYCGNCSSLRPTGKCGRQVFVKSIFLQIPAPSDREAAGPRGAGFIRLSTQLGWYVICFLFRLENSWTGEKLSGGGMCNSDLLSQGVCNDKKGLVQILLCVGVFRRFRLCSLFPAVQSLCRRRLSWLWSRCSVAGHRRGTSRTGLPSTGRSRTDTPISTRSG